MFLRLEVFPYPEEARALAALEAARVVCEAGGVLPIVAKKDHLLITNPHTTTLPAHMVSDAEIGGAYTWEVALTAARHMLRIATDASLNIEVLTVKGSLSTIEQHGPDRDTWRRSRTADAQRLTDAILERVQRDISS